ncbi:hypothetical protein BJ508DRAFT_412703 [Ascobolus immersus RN42]|uniref:LysM domain-containing protein n=1 Tax=Ascobolus immersus RN42 TaxID=1160509 RepID=A0A3N4IDS2_ASCIM|nr:hypothetical protein BJ508DRAFT_412703 [Ascobolus immersus RN42]
MKFHLTLTSVLLAASTASAGLLLPRELSKWPVSPWGETQGPHPQCNRFDSIDPGATCEFFTKKYPGLTLALLQEWNTKISSTSGAYDCFLLAHYKLCTSIVGFDWAAITPGNGTIPEPTPTPVEPYDPGTIDDAEPGTVVHQRPGWQVQAGQPVDCESWYVVKGGDQCQFITHKLGISQELLYEYNPSLGANCERLWANYGYCIGTVRNPYVEVPTPTGPPEVGGTPLPTQTGMVEGCKRWTKTEANDNCWYIADRSGVEGGEEELVRLNPVLRDVATCSEQLWAGYYLCVEA